jgi:hypothetical protein
MREALRKTLGIKDPDYFILGVLEEHGSDDLNRKEIEEKIGELMRRTQSFCANEALCSRLLALIERARTAGRAKNWDHAWQALNEASIWLNRAIISESLRPFRLRLLLVPLIWFMALLGIQAVVGQPQGAHNLLDWINAGYFSYLWFGMFGGTTILLWGLVKHSSEMNFDGSYVIWYLLKPALGAIMGMMAVLMTKGGFFALKGDPANLPHIGLALIAYAGGFSERFFLRLIDRVISSVFEGGNEGASRLEIERLKSPAVEPVKEDPKSES